MHHSRHLINHTKHSMDFLFSIALFFVFASTALVVLLLSANIYQHNVHQSMNAFDQNTTLAYLTEKIRQNDSSKTNISLTTFDGYEALAISQEYNDICYTTYIYEMDGKLKELFIQNGVSAPAQSGTTVLEIYNLEMKELKKGLFKFTCYSEDGTKDSVIIGLQSDSK